jgi:hypothetical protein
MRTVVVRSDRCLSVIAGDMAVVELKGVLKPQEAVDLCDGCARAPVDWLRRGPPGASKNEGAKGPSLDN